MRMKISPTTATVTALALLTAAVLSPAVAQATVSSGLSAQRVAPTSALQPLRKLTGNWTCTGTTTLPDGSQLTFDTSSTARFILDGNFMRWQETNSIDGTPIASAEYIWGWDAQQGQFTADRFDNSGQRGAQTTPGWVGNVLTSTGVLIQPDGTSLPLTTTITKTARNAFTVQAAVSLGAAAGGASVVSESSCVR
ncbi:DUF1579 domain-containing protein [Micromonospora sp. HNM0581]|uniref:DUF1579 family protein n=1 Tax=Micromonospora sp. HNM0581 TaxID=2716341 RepID=UPI00146A6B7A|nr:DUF1579 family protein [Micromonospora sp. HNM0581]NLU78446.1 DUF1579 domain-containing protein [Micromonospora sp. HNM0581]